MKHFQWHRNSLDFSIRCIKVMDIEEWTVGYLIDIAIAYHAGLGIDLWKVTFEQKHVHKNLVHYFEQDYYSNI